MKCFPIHRWIAVAVLAALGAGCSDDGQADLTAEGLKRTGKDVAQSTKEVGEAIGDELSEAADGLESFAKSLAGNMNESAEDAGRSIQSKMPEVENLVDQAKAKLNAGTAETKLLAAQLDDKLQTLKTRLDALAREGAQATQEMKDDVVHAFQDLVASIRSGLAQPRS